MKLSHLYFYVDDSESALDLFPHPGENLENLESIIRNELADIGVKFEIERSAHFIPSLISDPYQKYKTAEYGTKFVFDVNDAIQHRKAINTLIREYSKW